MEETNGKRYSAFYMGAGIVSTVLALAILALANRLNAGRLISGFTEHRHPLRNDGDLL